MFCVQELASAELRCVYFHSRMGNCNDVVFYLQVRDVQRRRSTGGADERGGTDDARGG